ncbi:hypothetical protein [Kaistia algarum]|uniref:hypothetical protein n=1 Tax=Kaistia algarum TaxID=2083279 RepID=UPI001402C007|nr:hypothetical protein [Kaistia algarum]MCX5516214.1 hypothetical protein [Kaistia algarum]
MKRSGLPAPLVPPEVDLRDTPPPRDLFISMAMQQFGLSREAATALVDDALQGVNNVH